MHNERILYLLEKCAEQTASPDEIKELDRWYHTFDQKEKLTYNLPVKELRKIEKRLLSNIDRQIGPLTALPVMSTMYHIKGMRWLAIASMALIFFCIGYLLVTRNDDFKAQEMSRIDALPGGNKAILVLGNGKRIDLSSTKQGTIARIAGITISKVNKTTLRYNEGTTDAFQSFLILLPVNYK